MAARGRQKISFEINAEKVPTAMVEVALSESLKLRQRQELVELLFQPDALALDDPATMISAWR